MRHVLTMFLVVGLAAGLTAPLPVAPAIAQDPPEACISETEVEGGVFAADVAPDGGAALAVQRWDEYDPQAALVRLLPDGRVDLAHGSSGEVLLDFPAGRFEYVTNVVADSGGGAVVVAGLSGPAGIATVRVRADGSVDPAWPMRAIEGIGVPRTGAVVDSRGRLLVGVSGDSEDGGVARIRPGGTLDPAYGDAGVGALPGLSADLAAVDEDVVVVATMAGWEQTYTRLWRLDRDGQLDTGWGEDGTLILEETQSVTLPTGFGAGVLVRVGRSDGSALLALDAAGQPDPTFGSGGEATLPEGATAGGVATTEAGAPVVLTWESAGPRRWLALTGAGAPDGAPVDSGLDELMIIDSVRADGAGARALGWDGSVVAIARFRVGCDGPGAPAPPIPPPTEGVRRLAGPDRFATAAAVSEATYPSADVVVLATGSTFPDALAGGPLAASINGPVLLTTRETLTEPTRAELVRLRARRAIVLGGEVAVAGSVIAELAALGIEADRVSGPDRFATAAAVSQAAFPNGAEVAIIATGQDVPDALAGAAIGARIGAPVLLVAQGAVPTPTLAELNRLGADEIWLLGGPAAVSEDVVAQLDGHSGTGRFVWRIGGESRFGTAALAAAQILALAPGHSGDAPPERVFLATGLNFPDALAAGAAAAAVGAPLLLVTPDVLPEPTRRVLALVAPLEITLLGGAAAIGDGVGRQAIDRAVTGWTPLEPVGDTRAARWDPCSPVRWAFNPDGAPDGALTVVTDVMASAAAASGLDLRYVGTTDAPVVSAEDVGPDGVWLPLRVGWSDDMGDLFDGLGGITFDGETGTVVTGFAAARPWGDSSAESYRTVLLHEVGHALGLGHVGHPTSVMYPWAEDTAAYSAGDRLGLRTLGADGGCAPPAPPPGEFMNVRRRSGPAGPAPGEVRMVCHLPAS